MRVARLLSMVYEIDVRPGVTAGELARDLGVSVRTVHRDVAALQAAGVPVYGTPGRHGGLRLVDGYRSGAASIRADEAAALLAGMVPGVAAQLGVEADADRALRKVRSQAGDAGGQVLVDPVGWYRSPDEVPHLALVGEAMRTRRLLSIRYSRWAEPTEVRRQIAPHGLVLKAGAWYVVARSRRRLRTYRVNQIRAARLTDRTFIPEDDFDLAATWTAFVASFRERLHAVDARVLADDATMATIRREGDPAMVDALDGAAPCADRPGWWSVDLPYESADRAVADVLRFGLGAELVGPPELLDRLTELVGSIARRYLDPSVGQSSSSPSTVRRIDRSESAS